MVAIDGALLPVPDCPANLTVFTRQRLGNGTSGYPQLRLTALVACGTRSVIAAVRRNRDPRTGAYHPFHAQRRAVVRRARAKDGKIQRDPELKQFIQRHLDQRWSPEQISQALRTCGGRKSIHPC
ncbi:hypothetical protein OIE66_07090 [Nonomuraea sp. NBC_01738]|nr:hypothetical protein OIE66_07090 [Nonomuraea sp. NBC_01738]